MPFDTCPGAIDITRAGDWLPVGTTVTSRGPLAAEAPTERMTPVGTCVTVGLAAASSLLLGSPANATAGLAKLMAIYKTPKDAAAFDKYYVEIHAPLAKKMPGLRSFEVSSGAVGLPVEPGAVHLVAILEFDSAEAIGAALGSPEGKATAADLANFADGGVDLMIFNSKPA